MVGLRMKSFVAILAMIIPMALNAETADSTHLCNRYGWYVGAEGGSSFGFCTFSSFGHDKTHFGGTIGINGGYRFNAILSAELSVKFDKIVMAARGCCAERDYWLGSDGVMYKASVLGMDSWNYSDLKSRVTVGRYGAGLNVNLLGLFRKTCNSRWTVAVSPRIYAVSSKANIRTVTDDSDAGKYPTSWHFGYGSDLQLGYQLTPLLQLGLYSGLTNLTGSRMDGMPEYLHKNNFIWENGVRIGINLSRKRQKNKTIETADAQPIVVPQKEIEPVEAFHPEDTVVNKVETEVASLHVEGASELTFPNIYFAFNQITIRRSELPKLNAVLKQLKENPDVKVSVIGWCDAKGSQSVNKRISYRRAEAVRMWLIRHGIERERIRAIGNGIDYDAQDAAKARRVVTEKTEY